MLNQEVHIEPFTDYGFKKLFTEEIKVILKILVI